MGWVRAIFLVLGAGLLLGAGPLRIDRDDRPRYLSQDCPGDVCSTATGLDSDQYTGWIHVDDRAVITLEVTFTDANDSVTALQATCQTSDSNTTANGSGFDVCSVGVAAGTGTRVCPYTDSLTTGTAEKFTMEWASLPHTYLNCKFHATGVPAAADTILVGVKRRSPW